MFQCLTTFTVKNFFLVTNLNQLSFSLKPLLLVLLQQTQLNRLSLSIPLFLIDIYTSLSFYISVKMWTELKNVAGFYKDCYNTAAFYHSFLKNI